MNLCINISVLLFYDQWISNASDMVIDHITCIKHLSLYLSRFDQNIFGENKIELLWCQNQLTCVLLLLLHHSFFYNWPILLKIYMIHDMDQNAFWSKKNFAAKDFWSKNFFSPKKCWVKNFWAKKTRVQKIRSKKFGSIRNLGRKKLGPKKFVGAETCLLTA